MSKKWGKIEGFIRDEELKDEENRKRREHAAESGKKIRALAPDLFSSLRADLIEGAKHFSTKLRPTAPLREIAIGAPNAETVTFQYGFYKLAVTLNRDGECVSCDYDDYRPTVYRLFLTHDGRLSLGERDKAPLTLGHEAEEILMPFLKNAWRYSEQGSIVET